MNTNLRKKLQENIVIPAADSRGSVTLSGVVKKVNEKLNTCTVKFTNFDGKEQVKNSVPVYLYNKSIIDWFPSVNEKVLLQHRNGVIYITGPAYSESYNDIRNELTLEQDIYAESFIDGIGGYLF